MRHPTFTLSSTLPIFAFTLNFSHSNCSRLATKLSTCSRLAIKAGGGGAVCIVPFLKASPWRSSRPHYATSEGNPRSVDQMTATLWCRFPLGGVIREGVYGPRDQWKAFWWSGVSAYTLLAADLGGMAPTSDARRWTCAGRWRCLASWWRRRQLDRARLMQQYNTEDGLVAGGCSGLIPGRRPG